MALSRNSLLAAAGAVALMFVTACGSSPEPTRQMPEEVTATHSDESASEEIAVAVIGRGNNASTARRSSWYGIEDRRQLEAALGATGARMSDAARSDAEARLDAGDMLALVVLGERPTGGYSIVPVFAVSTDDGVHITVREQRPSPGIVVTQALTYPWVLLAVPSVPIVGIEFLES